MNITNLTDVVGNRRKEEVVAMLQSALEARDCDRSDCPVGNIEVRHLAPYARVMYTGLSI